MSIDGAGDARPLPKDVRFRHSVAVPQPRLFLLLVVVLELGGAACRRPAVEPVRTPDPETRRELAGGSVIGFTGEYGAHVWRGLPYAEPPVGPLRWRAPRPGAKWVGTREALAPAPYCVQLPSVFGGVEAADHDTPVGQEDCLYLNVFAPPFPPRGVPAGGARLPVMVWIHGGGNVVGHAGRYDGGNLAVSGRAIVVMINYRLGPLGWFRHAALRAGATDDDDRSGNYGTLDMIRALGWVRDNVGAFGGDPDDVTIFGESAGGRDVFTLLLSPRAKGLFARAIVQSGGTATTPPEAAESYVDATPPGDPNSSAEVTLRLLAPGRSRDEAKTFVAGLDASMVAAKLRALPAGDVFRAYRTDSQEGLIDVPQIFRDGAVLPTGHPLEAIRAGKYNAVPTMLGTNKDENKLFLALNPEFTWRLFGLVPIVRDGALYDATARHLTRHWRARGVDEPAMALRAAQNPAVFAYRWDWDEEPTTLGVDIGRLLGAAHGLEIPFVFGHWDLGSQTNLLFSKSNEAGRRELSERMMAFWTMFARSGDPNGPATGKAKWEPYEADGRAMVLDTTAGGGIRMEKGRLTTAQALADVATDPALSTDEARCAVYRNFVRWAHDPSPSEYSKMAGGACARFPLAP